jgi:type IV pilus assembly protein PilE
MTTRPSFRAARPRGFTLIELMITVTVVAILAAVALPAFNNQIRKSRRTDARTMLLDLSARAERMYSATNSYWDAASALTPVDLGYPAGTAWPLASGGGYYTVNISNSTASTYTFTATVTGAQTTDTTCKTFVVDNTGKQSAADSSNADQTQTCWN